MRILVLLLLIHITAVLSKYEKPKAVIDDLKDLKEFKQVLRGRINILVLFHNGTKAAKIIKEFRQAAEITRGEATTVIIDCAKKPKLCKSLKTVPKPVECKHYYNHEFHKLYDRPYKVNSFVEFLRDPHGDPPWSDDSASTDVIHLKNDDAVVHVIKTEKRPLLIMFYTNWCEPCRKVKVEFAQAASNLKAYFALAALNMLGEVTHNTKYGINVTDLPTMFYFKDGQYIKQFDHARTAAGIAAFMKDPLQNYKMLMEDWEMVPDTALRHLNEKNFESVLRDQEMAIVYFHAPYCAECGQFKQLYENVASLMHTYSIPGMIIALDLVKNPNIGKKYLLPGFPTTQYYVFGEFQYRVIFKTEDELLAFVQNPVKPHVDIINELEWKQGNNTVEHLEEDTFEAFLKNKKRALVVFHKPWNHHSKVIREEINLVAQHFKDKPDYGVAAVDCVIQRDICESQRIFGHPTIKIYNEFQLPTVYRYGINVEEMTHYMNDPNVRMPAFYGRYSGAEHILILLEETIDQAVIDHTNLLIFFYTPDCKECTAFKAEYATAAANVNSARLGMLAAMDTSISDTVEIKYRIRKYPTLKHYMNGKFTREIESRDEDDIYKIMLNVYKFIHTGYLESGVNQPKHEPKSEPKSEL